MQLVPMHIGGRRSWRLIARRTDFRNGLLSHVCNLWLDFIVGRNADNFKSHHLLHRNDRASSSALLELQSAYLANLLPAIDSREESPEAASSTIIRPNAAIRELCTVYRRTTRRCFCYFREKTTVARPWQMKHAITEAVLKTVRRRSRAEPEESESEESQEIISWPDVSIDENCFEVSEGTSCHIFRPIPRHPA